MIESQISSLGTNLIIVMPGAGNIGGANQGAGTFNRLTVDDAQKLKREATMLAGVSPVVSTRTQVIGGQGNWRTLINGVSLDFLAIRDWTTRRRPLYRRRFVPAQGRRARRHGGEQSVPRQ
jgi:putative ABC transport system permease protein